MSPALVDTGATADVVRLPRTNPNGQFLNSRFRSIEGCGSVENTEVCEMNDDASGNSKPDGIGGGYCFSAAPPMSRSSSGGGGRGRMSKGRKPKSISGIGVDQGVKPFVGGSDGVSTSLVGSGVGPSKDWGFGFGQRRSGLGLGADLDFTPVGNVEKGIGYASEMRTVGIGGSLSVEDCSSTEKASTSTSNFEFGTGLKTNANVGGFKGTQEVDDKKSEKVSFVFGGSGIAPDSLATKLDDKNIGEETKAGCLIQTSVLNRPEVPSLLESVTHLTDVTVQTASQSLLNVSSIPASGSRLPDSGASDGSKSGDTFDTSSVEPASCLDGQNNNVFSFSSRTDGIEFRSASAKPAIFSAVDQKVEFTAKRNAGKSNVSKKKKDKMKPTPVQTRRGHFGKDFLMKDISPSMSCFSPHVSSFPELFSGNRISRESSLTSHESFDLGSYSEQSDSRLSDSNDAVEEDFVALTQQLGLNEHEFQSQEIVSDTPSTRNPNYTGINALDIDSSLGNETRALNAASENLDAVCENSRSSFDTATASNTGRLKISGMPEIRFPSTSEASVQSKFTFAASIQTQEFAATRVLNKKNQQKVGADSLSANLNVPYVSSAQFYQLASGTSLPSSPRTKKTGDMSYPRHIISNNSQVNDEGMCKNDASSTIAATLFAQETCEKWRIRGNEAYAREDFSRAEEYYTNGVNAIPQTEKSKNCHRVLMLCYSNRAASRMALGKMRGALEDCMFASAIDPSFLKVQLRAANCYLALGEVENASHYFKKLLQSGADIVDRKILVEASEGLQNVKKVSQCINQSTELLLQGAISDANNLLRALDEALLISPYCEKLLETKAETIFKLRKYEEVIQLCEHSLSYAEMNRPTLIGDDQLTDQDDYLISKYYYFRLWRYHLIVKSCFQLGKLEQAVELLEKEASRKGSEMLESSIPLACTIRELVRLKVAGNDAFQSGKYDEAVEHYSAALARNLGSLPFAAICYCNRAAAYKALNQIADAISDCSLAMALDRNYYKAISRRASLFEAIRDYDQAAKDLRRLISLLKKKIEENKNLFGTSDRSTNLSFANDLREAEVRLSEMEEEARKDVLLNFYLILGVEPLASPTEIRKAYRKSALKHHPDKAGQILGKNDVEDDTLWKEVTDEVHRDIDKLFKMIGEAYAVLSDTTKRSRYDLQEEMRSTHRKGKGSTTPRTQTEFQNHSFERSSSGRQWTEMWRSYRQSESKTQEASQSKWYAG
ncbi:unnamed protein product [Rhodiola kirilowii]